MTTNEQDKNALSSAWDAEFEASEALDQAEGVVRQVENILNRARIARDFAKADYLECRANYSRAVANYGLTRAGPPSEMKN